MVNTKTPDFPRLTPLWTSENLPMAESVVLVNAETDYLLVSLIDGDPTQKDGKGGIAQVGLDGKLLDGNWYSGLNAPKGMAIYGNELWVTDIDSLVVVDIPSQKLLRNIAIIGAQFLNDIAIDAQGRVYVSDTFTHTIYRLTDGNLEIYAKDIQAANGLLLQKNSLLVATSNKLLQIDDHKNKQFITQHLFPEADGIQPWTPDSWLVSSWKGKLYLVDHNNEYLLWDAKAEGLFTADILYLPEQKLLLVPGLFNNSLRAYQIN